MQKFRSYCFSYAFMIWTFLISILCLPLLIPGTQLALITSRIWSKGCKWMMAGMVGLRYETRGMENVPEGPCILASKHQSAFDTYVFHELFDRIAYVYKKELGYIPFVGWQIYMSGSIPVDRSSGAKAMRTLLEGAERSLKKGFKVVIFPEGTRTAVDAAVEYNPGIAFLYDKLKDVKVIPVALNSGLFWPRYSFLKKKGTIIIEFLPAMSAGMSKRDFLQQLENKIENSTKKLVEESRK